MPLTTAARGSEKGRFCRLGWVRKRIGEFRWHRCTFWLCLPGSPAKVNPLDGSESFIHRLAYRPIWAGVTKTFEQISWLPDVGQTWKLGCWNYRPWSTRLSSQICAPATGSLTGARPSSIPTRWQCKTIQDRNLSPGRATWSGCVRPTETTFDGRAESTRSPEKVWQATVDPAGRCGPFKNEVLSIWCIGDGKKNKKIAFTIRYSQVVSLPSTDWT